MKFSIFIGEKNLYILHGQVFVMKLVGRAMIDFREASDLVDHELLLRIYKFSKSSLSWFKSYLDNRTQQVVINDSSSSNGDVVCGVPHASVLGPLLFLFLSMIYYCL